MMQHHKIFIGHCGRERERKRQTDREEEEEEERENGGAIDHWYVKDAVPVIKLTLIVLDLKY